MIFRVSIFDGSLKPITGQLRRGAVALALLFAFSRSMVGAAQGGQFLQQQQQYSSAAQRFAGVLL